MARIVGRLLIIDAAILLIPMCVSIIYGESDWLCFLVAAGAAAVCGFALTAATLRCTGAIRPREGFIITALIWVVFGLFGIIPLMTCATPLGFTDAFFEIISGYTTTGASVIRDVEALSHGILFWRALSQWIGGPGITHDKLHPRIRQTALSLWGVYVSLTVVSVLLLWAGPMDLFDSVCHTFTTIATGGFSTRNDGLAWWNSQYVYWIVNVMMLVAGLNFMILFQTWHGNFSALGRNTVANTYFCIILTAFVMLLPGVASRGESGVDEWLTYPLFHVVSAITSTGFGVPGTDHWGPTTGGIKVDRLVVMWQNLRNETRVTAFPKRMYVVSLYGSALDNSLVSRVAAFCTVYFLILGLSAVIVTFVGYSLEDSLLMVASCIGCNGLGFGATGAEGGFGLLPDTVKWLLTADMLLGRLEIFTYLVLFIPSFWRR